MPFEKILVAIDGSACSDRAFAKAIELAKLTGAQLTALAIEGPLPAYAATIGEVDEVKREKDLFFNPLATAARERATHGGVEIAIDVRAATPPRSSPRSQRRAATTSSCSATAATSSATTCSARPQTASPNTRRAP